MRNLFSIRFSTLFLLAFCLLGATSSVMAQSQRDVVTYIAMLDQGKYAQVRQAMPQLITQFQNSPELTYLQARLEPDGMEATKLYRGILENFPKCDYADDALLHVYQYDYMSGLYQSADKDLQRLKTDYPSSPTIAAVNEVVVPREPPTGAAVAPTPVARPERQSRQSASKARPAFSLQVGAFSTTENAEKLKRRFEQLGYPVEISNKVMERKTLYVVWVGSFPTADQARAEVAKIKSREKVTPMVIER